MTDACNHGAIAFGDGFGATGQPFCDACGEVLPCDHVWVVVRVSDERRNATLRCAVCECLRHFLEDF